MKSLYDYCIERDDFVLLVEWDRTANGGLEPRTVSHASHTKVRWRCAYGHKWTAAVYSRSLYGAGCPVCSGRKPLPLTRTLADSHPELAAQWHTELNGTLSPAELAPGSPRRVWWVCEKGHQWRAQVKSRTQGAGCPYCSNRKLMPGENDLSSTHPLIAAKWDRSRNGPGGPETVLGGNHTKVWWLCEKGHSWQASVLSRTSLGSGCPVCAGKLVVAGENDLAGSYPQIAQQWNHAKNGVLTPQQLTAFSNRKVWWVCEKGHEYRAVVAHRTQNGSGCPYCSNRRVLAGFNDLATVLPDVAKQWYEPLNGALTPQMVTPGSGKKVWWQCSEGHVWQAVVYSRTGDQKSGCPVCSGRVKKKR